MPESFYGLYSQLTSYGPDPGTKTCLVRYYKYVEDANYHAGKLFEYYLTSECIDELQIWQKIANSGATPFVHTIAGPKTNGMTYYTMIVREETLHEDVDDISTGSPRHTVTTTKTRRDASTSGMQDAGFQPAFADLERPQVIPTAPSICGPTMANKHLHTRHPSHSSWLLCQPAFSTNPASKLSGFSRSSSEVSSSGISDSETSDSGISDSLASISEMSLLDPKTAASLDQNTSIPVNGIDNHMDDVCFLCLDFNHNTATYYNTGCSACLPTPTPTTTTTGPATRGVGSTSTISPNNQLLSELRYYNDTRPYHLDLDI